jgi:hypothetical protein
MAVFDTSPPHNPSIVQTARPDASACRQPPGNRPLLLELGFISFDGPFGQISTLHKELTERPPLDFQEAISACP